jgi:addiction module HigA family antidote
MMKESSHSDYLEAVTVGEILLNEFLLPMGISQRRLAKEVDVSANRINEIVKARRRITADTDLRLCRFFGLTKGYWLRAQILYDLEVNQVKIEEELSKIKPWKL